VGHTYALPVVKLLFATARSCAYPGCSIPLVFIDADHGVREVAVQIAHIRSPKPGGPRYEPDFPADKLNSEENLLLLCGVHHHPIDMNGSKYTTEELLGWKKEQTSEDGGFIVQDEDIQDLATRLESSLGELVQATRLQLDVLLVGGWVNRFTGEVARVDLDVFEEFGRRGAHMFRSDRLIGLEVQNQGPVGAEVRAAGIDFDLGPGLPAPWQYAFPANDLTPWQFPCRVDGHSARDWFEDEHALRRFADWLFASHSHGPRQFRAWATLGNGERHTGGWVPRASLPIWEPGVTENQLRTRYRELE
jgi:hypothetical protein